MLKRSIVESLNCFISVSQILASAFGLPSSVFGLRSSVFGLPSSVFRLPSSVFRLRSSDFFNLVYFLYSLIC
ncbi:MAG: hypothetical protein CVU08_14355 [Bacteroidetes bacterium HGW-Bacteroidetes-3]|nr:MAG: hypothetical protein CVU08_14355 [Bacteroidetes bacterium HGW-Bacteroidetes-3]